MEDFISLYREWRVRCSGVHVGRSTISCATIYYYLFYAIHATNVFPRLSTEVNGDGYWDIFIKLLNFENIRDSGIGWLISPFY